MAVERRSYSKQQHYVSNRSFAKALTSAVSEWFLILIMFVNGILSYWMTKFAAYFELQTPCMLCSRLDHVLGDGKQKHYSDFFCGHHKKDISSLVFCQAHGKLVDVNKICEPCLFSFALINKSNAETYRLLVGMIGEESRLKSNRDTSFGCHETFRRCSCCNQPLMPFGYMGNFRHAKRGESEIHNAGKRSGKQSVSLGERRIGFQHFSNVGYSELSVQSDYESDLEWRGGRVRKFNNPSRVISLMDDPATEKLIDRDFNSEPSMLPALFVSEEKPNGVAFHHGLEELTWQEINYKNLDDVPLSPADVVGSSIANVIVSLYDAPASSNVKESSSKDIVLSDARKVSEEEKKELADDYLPSSDLVESQVEVSKEEVSSVRDIEVEDLKTMSQKSATPSEVQSSDASSYVGNKLSKKLSFERNDSNLSLEGSIVGEIEGESEVERLKRQVVYDKELVSALSKELEEERNASAISTNQAMAMITRLQEEKATFQMEALQNLRMMEEQAEYDLEALQATEDLLAEKEKEIQDLEAELEFYRGESSDPSVLENSSKRQTMSDEFLESLIQELQKQRMTDMEELQKTDDLLTDKEKKIQDLEAELVYYRSKFPDASTPKIAGEKLNSFDKVQEINVLPEDAQ